MVTEPGITSAHMDSVKQRVWEEANIRENEPTGYITIDSLGHYDLDTTGFVLQGPCQTQWKVPPPFNAQGSLHPHTKPGGMDLTAFCHDSVTKNGVRQVVPMRAAGNNPSPADKKLMRRLYRDFQYEEPNYILTNDYIIKFQYWHELDDVKIDTFPRCGY
jgi:hypothetical protein